MLRPMLWFLGFLFIHAATQHHKYASAHPWNIDEGVHQAEKQLSKKQSEQDTITKQVLNTEPLSVARKGKGMKYEDHQQQEQLIAFSAVCTSTLAYLPESTIIFDEVITNEGGAYVNNTGQFACTNNDTYVFTWSLARASDTQDYPGMRAIGKLNIDQDMVKFGPKTSYRGNGQEVGMLKWAVCYSVALLQYQLLPSVLIHGAIVMPLCDFMKNGQAFLGSSWEVQTVQLVLLLSCQRKPTSFPVVLSDLMMRYKTMVVTTARLQVLLSVLTIILTHSWL